MNQATQDLVDLERQAHANPNDPAGWHNLGLGLASLNRLPQAAACLQRAAALNPQEPSHHQSLATILMAQGDKAGAAASFQRLLALNPNSFDALINLGILLRSAGQPQAAGPYFQRAVLVDPASVDARLAWVWTLRDAGKLEEARTEAHRAMQLQPQDPRPHEALAGMLQHEGKFEEAIAHYETAVSLSPQPSARSLQGIVQSKKITESDRLLVERLLESLKDPTRPPRDRLLLHLSLGKAYDNLCEYELAMHHFDLARQVAAGLSPVKRLDRAPVESIVAWSKRHFPAGVFGRHPPMSQSELPIFIVGMPRSGTTLLEQIISSHPQIGAAGEQPFWRQSPLMKNRLSVFEPGLAQRMAAEYVRVLGSIAPGKQRVTDKMPLNYSILGQLHLMFPNARIIHCRRHPVDTCLSILMNTLDLPSPPHYAYHLDDMVFFYRKYLELMEHWRQILPHTQLLELDYESLVSDKETVTRKAIEFCGLEWDDACLSHERNERIVETPSKWQVRQPVYTTAAGRWRHYEPWLGPLKQLLPE